VYQEQPAALCVLTARQAAVRSDLRFSIIVSTYAVVGWWLVAAG
jgi:hypothetical protein